ncbi:MAG TPA: serine/threonine-protein kinase [Micromonosporaceae bacterium]|nr:serine/threonine-protein kinase [Micromonosporaceae bacterium]
MAEAVVAGHRIAGRYRLHRPLGSGSVGQVWHGHDELLDRPVALKEIIVPFGLDISGDALLESAVASARVAARLHHPNIVPVFDVVPESGCPWIVMHYVPGRSLQTVVTTGGPLDVPATARIAGALLDAVAAAHSAGILHLDIKPSNVLIADDGGILLTDFSAARATGAGAPADLFGIGTTLHFALEGGAPADAAAAGSGPARAGALAPLLDGLLSRDPARRPTVTQAREMLVALGGAGPMVAPSALGQPAPTVVPRHAPARPRGAGWRGRRLVAIEAGAAAALVVLVALTLVLITKGHQPAPTPSPAALAAVDPKLQLVHEIGFGAAFDGWDPLISDCGVPYVRGLGDEITGTPARVVYCDLTIGASLHLYLFDPGVLSIPVCRTSGAGYPTPLTTVRVHGSTSSRSGLYCEGLDSAGPSIKWSDGANVEAVLVQHQAQNPYTPVIAIDQLRAYWKKYA